MSTLCMPLLDTCDIQRAVTNRHIDQRDIEVGGLCCVYPMLQLV
jgi:hypothetical protein